MSNFSREIVQSGVKSEFFIFKSHSLQSCVKSSARATDKKLILEVDEVTKPVRASENLDAEEDSELIIGFNHQVDKTTYSEHVKNGTISELLNTEKIVVG
ncbi:MAG: hypothetical protein AAGD38_11525, partial [Acidobacteriota bacterium]